MNAQALVPPVARFTSFGQFPSAQSLLRVPRLMSMAGLLAASLLLAASPIRAQDWPVVPQVSPKEFLTASQEFVEKYKKFLQDGTISDQEAQQLRPLVIRLKEIVDALPCGGSYDYFDLAGRQTLHKGPAPECRLITTKSGGLPWNIALPPVVPSDTAKNTLTNDESMLTNQFNLDANYPNPFNAETQMTYALPVAGAVELAIYNVQGQRVRTLVQGVQAAGRYQIAWDGRSDSGAALSSGVYLSRLASAQGVQVRRLALIK